ncbi:MAG: hypothetical protein Q8T09_15980 [Candidatus Melainabacteria bacterium]|nr:hypothetical protein [Candidatus Melainabacteria bacterium]
MAKVGIVIDTTVVKIKKTHSKLEDTIAMSFVNLAFDRNAKQTKAARRAKTLAK